MMPFGGEHHSKALEYQEFSLTFLSPLEVSSFPSGEYRTSIFSPLLPFLKVYDVGLATYFPFSFTTRKFTVHVPSSGIFPKSLVKALRTATGTSSSLILSTFLTGCENMNAFTEEIKSRVRINRFIMQWELVWVIACLQLTKYTFLLIFEFRECYTVILRIFFAGMSL
jgi:hypothetical protein